MDKKIAQNLIAKTRQDYNKIATEFSSSRSYMWPDIAMALEKMDLKKCDKVLDIGCGNGRIAPLVKKSGASYTGVDISDKLIEIAKETYPDEKFKVANMTSLPFPDKSFDAVISIAALHHLPGEERIKAISEIGRVLKDNGTILISVWYFWHQPKYLKLIAGSSIKKITGSGLDYGDFFLPWKDSGKKIMAERYLHAFRKRELEHLLSDDFETKKVPSDRNLIFIGHKR